MATLQMTGELAYPIFASRNWISQDSVDYGSFAASEMTALLERVIDGDRFSYWQGSSFSDLTSVVLTFSFQLRTANIERAFDLVILQNINWKNFLGEYQHPTTGVWTTITALDYTVSNNAATDRIVNIPAGVSATGIRFTVTTTMTADDAKKAGNIIVCQSAIQLAGGFLDYKIKNREQVREVMLGDGTISREYQMRTAASYEFYGATFDCPIVTAAEKLLLRTIKREGYPFVLIPEVADHPEDAYQCHFDGAWGHQYENAVRSIGYMIPMKVKEVGSH